MGFHCLIQRKTDWLIKTDMKVLFSIKCLDQLDCHKIGSKRMTSGRFFCFALLAFTLTNWEQGRNVPWWQKRAGKTCVWGTIRGKMSGGKMCRGICPGGNVLYTPELVKVVFMQKWLRRPTLLLFSSIFGRSYCCTQCDRLLAWCRPSVRPSIRPSVCDEMFCGLKPKKTLWQTKKNKNWKLFTKKPVFTVLLPIVLLHAMWSSFCDEVFCGLKRKKN